MEKNDLRKKALQAIDAVQWIPAWAGPDLRHGGKPARLVHFPTAPLGVPITIFYCSHCGKELMTKPMMDYIVALIREHGADVWFEREPKA